jgi:hypothetical protein
MTKNISGKFKILITNRDMSSQVFEEGETIFIWLNQE